MLNIMAGNIHRQKKNRDFVTIDTHCLRNKDLRWDAKGLHSYLMQLPDDWKINVADLEKRSLDRHDGTMSPMRALIAAGYVYRERISGEKGRFVGYDYHLFERPEQTIEWLTVNGKTVNGKTATSKVLRVNKNEETTTKEKIDVNALIVDSLEFKADAFPPTPIAPPTAPRRFEPFDIDKEERMFLGAEDAMERYARETGTPREKMYFGFQDAVKAFTADQKTTGYNYNNSIDYRKHFFNLVRRKAEIKRSIPGASSTNQSTKANLNRYGGDASKYQETPLF